MGVPIGSYRFALANAFTHEPPNPSASLDMLVAVTMTYRKNMILIAILSASSWNASTRPSHGHINCHTGIACCARTANGHTAAPPRPAMNSRRLGGPQGVSATVSARAPLWRRAIEQPHGGIQMKRLVCSSVSLFALIGASSAIAADLELKAPLVVIAPLPVWTGCYLGGNLGGVMSWDKFTGGAGSGSCWEDKLGAIIKSTGLLSG